MQKNSIISCDSWKRIVITNRKLCSRPLPEQLERILGEVDMVILREKDLSLQEYETLAKEVLAVCRAHGVPCVLHTYAEAARRLSCRAVHLPLELLEEMQGELGDFDMIGTSCHSLEDAQKAERLGADYITASHIFATDCKKGLEPRGLEFLRNICEHSALPVYALGGITAENEALTRAAGAAGACRMSDYMRR